MRIPRALRLVPVLAGLLLILLVPAAKAAETLVLSCDVCDELVATGKGLPANSTVRLTVTDVKTGQVLVNSIPVTTDSQGAFVKKISMNLGLHPSVESSVWTTSGSVLVVAAHNRFTAPCNPDGSMEMMEGMHGMEHDTLAFTGSHTSLLLGVGSGLLALGAVLLAGSRRAARLGR